MKAFYLYASLCLLALGTSCSTNEDSMTWSDDPDAVIVNVTAGGLQTRSNPIADLTDEDKEKTTQFNENDKIKISYDNKSTITYTLTGGKWEPEEGKYLKWEDGEHTFVAWYPSDALWIMGMLRPVKNQSSIEDLQKADFMQTVNNITEIPKDRTLNLTLARRRARVVVNINKFNEQFGSDEKVKSITFFSDGTPYKLSGDGGVGTTYVFLIAPSEASSANEFLSIETTSGAVVKKQAVPEIKEGYSYTYSLNIGKDRIVFGEVTVEPWTDGGVLPDGGNISENVTRSLDGITAPNTEFIVKPNSNE